MRIIRTIAVVVGGVLLGLAAGSKYIPALLMPLFAAHFLGRERWRFLGGFFGVLAAVVAFVVLAGEAGNFLQVLTRRAGHGQNYSLWLLAPDHTRVRLLLVGLLGLFAWVPLYRHWHQPCSRAELLRWTVVLFSMLFLLHHGLHAGVLATPLTFILVQLFSGEETATADLAGAP